MRVVVRASLALILATCLSACPKPEQSQEPVDTRISSQTVKMSVAKNFGPAMEVMLKEIGNLGEYPAMQTFRNSSMGKTKALEKFWALVPLPGAAKESMKSTDPQAAVEMVEKVMKTPLFAELFSDANIVKRENDTITYALKNALCQHMPEEATKEITEKSREICQRLFEKADFQLTVTRAEQRLSLNLKFAPARDGKFLDAITIMLATNELKVALGLPELRTLVALVGQVIGVPTAELDKIEKLTGKLSAAIGFGEKAACKNGERFCVSISVDEKVEVMIPSLPLLVTLNASTPDEPLLYGSPQANNEVVIKYNSSQLDVLFQDYAGHLEAVAYEVHVPTKDTGKGNIAYLKNVKLGANNSLKKGDFSASFGFGGTSQSWEHLAMSPADYSRVEISPVEFEIKFSAAVELPTGFVDAKVRMVASFSQDQGLAPVLRFGKEPLDKTLAPNLINPIKSNPNFDWLKKMPKEMGMAILLFSVMPATNQETKFPTLWLDQGQANLEMSYELTDDSTHQGTISLNIPSGHGWHNELIDIKKLLNP